MAYIEWSEGLSVGYDEIDAQHRKMLSIINELFEEVTHRNNTQELLRIAQELMVYTEEHFTAEEGLMQSCGYPDLAEHQQQHIHFMEKIRDFSASIEEGEPSSILPLEMFHFLQTWLAEHIMRKDKLYAAYCKELKD